MLSFDLAIEVLCNPYKELLDTEMCEFLMNRKELNEDDRNFKQAYKELLDGSTSDAVFKRYCSDYERIDGITFDVLKQDLIDFSIDVRTERLRDLQRRCYEAGDWSGYTEANKSIEDIVNSYKDMKVFSLKEYASGQLVQSVRDKENDDSLYYLQALKK